MSNPSCVPLGSKGIDGIQSLVKTYEPSKEAHRTTNINEPFTKVCVAYKVCGRVCTITYLYDCTAEISQVTTTADSCGSLCGTYFSVYSANCVKEYRPFFIVCCGSCLPCNTCCIRYIAVNILTNDLSCVTALALRNAISGDCCAACDFCVSIVNNGCLNNIVRITNNTKGLASDINDSGCTGFTFNVTTQGTQTTTEKLTYVYDCFNRISSITNLTGTNVLDSIDVITCSINKTKVKQNNTVEVARTTIGACTPVKIELPCCATEFIIYHATCCKNLYYGRDACITTSVNSAPLEKNKRLEVNLDKGNDNNLYGISCCGCITVFAVGVYRE